MAQTRRYLSLPLSCWAQFVRYPSRSVPLTETGTSRESGYPWRSSRCRIVRVPLTRLGVAVGRWSADAEHEVLDGVPSMKMHPLENWEDFVHARVEEEGPVH